MNVIKQKKLCFMAIVLFLVAFTGCSHSRNTEMTNELHFSLDDISDVTISYDEELITFFEAEDDELTVKEYMTEDKSKYYAKVKQDDDSIHISEGGKPLLKNDFERHVEVYLPDSYPESLTITTTDGNIDLSGINLQLSKLHIDSTAGTVKINNASASDIHISSTSGILDLGKVEADTITLQTTSGKMTCSEMIGHVNYSSTSGDANIKKAVGSGNYKANNSGELHVEYTEVKGDLYLFNKNDKIQLKIPDDLDFEFEAETKNGSVDTTFQKYIKTQDRITQGTVGSNPTVTIKTETKNGDIEVTQ